MRWPRVVWRPPPSQVCHRAHGSRWEGEILYSPCGAILDCPQYHSKEGTLLQALRLGRRPCRHPACGLPTKNLPRPLP